VPSDAQSKDRKYKDKVRKDQTSCIQHALNRGRYNIHFTEESKIKLKCHSWLLQNNFFLYSFFVLSNLFIAYSWYIRQQFSLPIIYTSFRLFLRPLLFLFHFSCFIVTIIFRTRSFSDQTHDTNLNWIKNQIVVVT
jgi:hypothetical protein